MHHIFSEVSKAGKPVTVADKELRLIQSREDIENPKLCVTAVEL